jgi:hypothetical protein
VPDAGQTVFGGRRNGVPAQRFAHQAAAVPQAWRALRQRARRPTVRSRPGANARRTRGDIANLGDPRGQQPANGAPIV